MTRLVPEGKRPLERTSWRYGGSSVEMDLTRLGWEGVERDLSPHRTGNKQDSHPCFERECNTC